MITQTIAIFLDAYRELNAKKLFWITLAISGMVVVAFAAVGIDERGLSAFGIFIGPWLNTAMVPRDVFYKFIFAQVGVPFWLTWGAAILALVSTAGIIPDFVTGGGIDLVLAKPIGRLRLFLTKYAAALTFVGLQAAVFTLAVFLVIGLRGGSWEPAVFLAVPLVLANFSFIYCVCALVGLLTRSTIAALFGAIAFWIVVWASHTTESIYLFVKVQAEQTVVALEERKVSLERDLQALESPPDAPAPPAASDPISADAAPLTEPGAAPGAQDEQSAPQGFRAALALAARKAMADAGKTGDETKRENLQRSLARTTEALDRESKDLRSYRKGHAIAVSVKAVLPKTTETVQLLSRAMLSLTDMEAMQPGGDENRSRRGRPLDPDDPASAVNDDRAQREVQRLVRERPWWWVLGTSLLFEACVVGIAARAFCRRDF